MFLIVGLGNPGKIYEKTRHNVGFHVIDEFAKENNFPDFKLSEKYEAEISEGLIENEKVVLLKPQTFMNLSGKSIFLFSKNNKIDILKLFLIHDDIDIPFGKIKISKENGAGGHKGVDSIINSLSSKDFLRFRVGILPEEKKPKSVEKFVLQKFNKDEEEKLNQVIKNTLEALNISIKEKPEKAMTLFN